MTTAAQIGGEKEAELPAQYPSVPWANIVMGDRFAFGSFGGVYNATIKNMSVVVKKLEPKGGITEYASLCQPDSSSLMSSHWCIPCGVGSVVSGFQRIGIRDFRGEANVLARLQGLENVIQCRGRAIDESSQSYGLVFPPADGSLEKLLRMDNMYNSGTDTDKRAVAELACGVAKAVHGIHSLTPPIIHRDSMHNAASSWHLCSLLCVLHVCSAVACRNVLHKGTYALLADFGLARIKERVGQTVIDTTIPFKWMSPEALQHDLFSAKSDVYVHLACIPCTDTDSDCDCRWMFGVCLWEMFSRELPYEKMTPIEAAGHIMKNGSTLSINADWPKPIKDILGQCWQKSAPSRPTMQEVWEQLSKYRSSFPPAPAPIPPVCCIQLHYHNASILTSRSVECDAYDRPSPRRCYN